VVPHLLAVLSFLAVVSPGDSTQPARPEALAAHPASSSITVDGQLREADWSKAPAATDFRQFSPQEGTAPSQRTQVRVVYGKDALYVGATLHDEHPDRIRDRLGRRDQRNQADWFEVSIDSYYDQKTARTFAVNAAGVQRDGVVEGGGGLDSSWDGIWRSAVRVTDSGWTAELRIPYSMLRFSANERQTWGLQFRRRIPRNSEVLEWPLVPKSERRGGVVAKYADLTNLQNLSTSRNLQIAPYTLSQLESSEDPAAPGTRQISPSLNAGADLELGLGSSATLNATVNPDFGQVESDPAVLNLSAFETFFPEKRPFFVQGTDVFGFSLGGGGRLLYTRRIGGDESLIGAAKVTGRSQNGLVYGALGATTGDDFDPSRAYAVGRLRQDVGAQSTVGGMATVYDGPASSGRRRSATGGIDWDLRFLDQTYQFQGYLSTSHRRQTDSASSPTTGYALRTQGGRVKGNWTYDLSFRLLTDTFNPNDVGRLRQNNFFRTSGKIRHQVNGGQPIGPFQKADGFLFVGQSWSYRNRLSRGLGFFSRFSVLTDGFRELSLGINGDKLFGGYNLFETRGLWPRARPREFGGEVDVSTDTRRSWTLETEVGGGLRSDGQTSLSGNLELEWNVSNRLKLSSELSYEAERGAVEWASNEAFVRRAPDRWAIGESNTEPSNLDSDALTPLSTGNQRLGTILSDVSPTDDGASYYVPVYGERDTDRLDLTLRSNITLTPDLSIELFGQLFGARGRFQNFRILSSRDDFDQFGAYPKRHDFATSSFLSNTILRWEFRPGSELFVVWSQSRSIDRDDPVFADQRRHSPYDRSPSARLTDAFDDFATNSFIVKLRYVFI
jgi:hypothetical protein